MLLLKKNWLLKQRFGVPTVAQRDWTRSPARELHRAQGGQKRKKRWGGGFLFFKMSQSDPQILILLVVIEIAGNP